MEDTCPARPLTRADLVLRAALPPAERRVAAALSFLGGGRAAAMAACLTEFLAFGLKAAWSCLFGGLLLGALVATALWWPEGAVVARYDALFVFAVAIQAALVATGLERPREAFVILVFHVTGTVMEVFKTAHGSWAYPGDGVLFVGDVPLFSGFMYAAVGSYLARAWRVFAFRFERHPPRWAVLVLAAAIYANFFWHHYGPDVRAALFAASAVLFGRTVIRFRLLRREVSMPLLVGFALTSGFIYLAENIGTLTATWTYPDQAGRWRPVSPAKWGSWYLLMLLSYGLVAMLHAGPRRAPTPQSQLPPPSRPRSRRPSPRPAGPAGPPSRRSSA